MVAPEREGESVARRPGARPAKSAAAFRTISEVADELEVAQHVLRFWESKFPQVRPLKRGGGRRYYRPEDVELLRQIPSLLYEGGQHALGDEPRVAIGGRDLRGSPELPLERSDLSPELRARLYELRSELAALRKVLREV